MVKLVSVGFRGDAVPPAGGVDMQRICGRNDVGTYTLSVVESYLELSNQAADAVQQTLERRPDAAITVPTGQTPLGMYRELIRRIEDGTVDVSQVHVFCLDDYLGQSRHDEASLTRWLYNEFLTPAGIPEEHIHHVPSTAADPIAAAAQYEADLEALGGLELAVVGLGRNGHVAFNEPGSPPDSRTRVIDLTEESRQQSAAYWEGDAAIPEQAVTMGLGTILSARKIVLIASGEDKSEIVRRSLEEEPTLEVPGSWLKQADERLHVILDRAAAGGLATR
ncbi:MAG TPA: glucosamine-6-phosphate deaminase [Thermomicrobiales bacterium]|nr:glucosamine-6-phosphate deaminase [Thermomicrobiales bacterium]